MTVKVPRVSVVMGVLNGERYLKDAIECMLDQTFQDFEFIIVDDGPKDSTGEILSKYAQRDHRVRVVLSGPGRTWQVIE